MLKPLITRLLNHLIEQNPWAKEQLMPYAGKSVSFIIPPASTTFTVLENGGLAAAGDSSVAEASVSMPLSVAMRLLANDQAASSLVIIEGNTELATSLAKVLRNMSWQFEEDLSQLIGDAPAHQITEFGKKAAIETRKQVINAAEMLSEYWQEEQPVIAKKRHVDQFIKDVDELRDDVERLTKRLEKLATLIKQDQENKN